MAHSNKRLKQKSPVDNSEDEENEAQIFIKQYSKMKYQSSVVVKKQHTNGTALVNFTKSKRERRNDGKGV